MPRLDGGAGLIDLELSLAELYVLSTEAACLTCPICEGCEQNHNLPG